MLFGAGDIKKRVTLTSENFFQRCEMWWRYKTGCDPSVQLDSILRDMMRSGLFYPSTRWITPTQGRGMDKNRARVMFKMIRDYERVGHGDVNVIFFDEGQFDRYFRSTMEDVLRSHGDWPPEQRRQDAAAAPATATATASASPQGANPPGPTDHTSGFEFARCPPGTPASVATVLATPVTPTPVPAYDRRANTSIWD